MSDAEDSGVSRYLNGLQALTNPHRFEVLRLLREPALHFRPQAAGAPEDVGVCVSDLQEKLGLSQSTTSQYLAVLERARLVTSRRVGQWTYWQSSGPEIAAIVNFLGAALAPPPGPGALAPQAQSAALTPQDVFAARARVRAHIRHTPLEPSAPLSRMSAGSTFLKWENLQVTRSWEPRGCFNRLLQLTEEERRAGIVTDATGNHGLAVAYAGAQLGIRVEAWLPQTAGAETVRALRDLGTDVRFQADAPAASEAAQRAAREQGRVFLPEGFDPAMTAGAGTLALELLEDLPRLEAVAVCGTPGGLPAGVTLLLKAIQPGLRVYAVQPGPAPFAGPSVPPGFTDEVVTVTDEAVRTARQWVWDEHRFAIEPAGATALAWVLRRPPELQGRRAVAVVTGGNVSPGEAGSLFRP